ncbi:MAG TPA: serine hydrolase [Chloroflexota bacterium]|jgi:beta-lactamase class A|nr:serine hydrolase [Chloroflexota bacterium]
MRLGRRALLAALAGPVIACGPSRVVVSDRPARIEPTPGRAAAAAVPARQTAAAASPGTEAPPTPLADDGALQRQLDRFLGEQRGQFGVAVRDLHGPVAAAYQPRERFPLGSLFKLLLMYEVMRQVRLGVFPLAEAVRTPTEYAFGEPPGGLPPGSRVTVDEALAAMISVSSNAAALTLLELVRPAGLEAAPRRAGLVDTAIDVEPSGLPGHYLIDARGSAQDVASLLVRLDREELVGPDQDRRMIDLLLGQKIDDRLPALLPKDVPIAHKTADLDGFTHDAGMVYLPGRPYVLAIMAQGESPSEGKAIAAEVSRLVFTYFRGG